MLLEIKIVCPDCGERMRLVGYDKQNKEPIISCLKCMKIYAINEVSYNLVERDDYQLFLFPEFLKAKTH